MEDQEMQYGIAKNLTANSFTRQGYDFAGWRFEDKTAGKQYADKAQVNNLTDVMYKTVTMYAQWTPHKYTIKFDKNRADATQRTDSPLQARASAARTRRPTAAEHSILMRHR